MFNFTEFFNSLLRQRENSTSLASPKQMSETKRLADAQDHWRRLQAQYE
jgi:hypothetical protein